jgi:hypothetical protein
MADPICRWRNPYVSTVIELINLLPKEELTQQRAREIVVANSPYNAPFYTTPYQLACQLGLYHETNGRYFPKFTFVPNEEEVKLYLQNWIVHYCVPNPYTRSFEDLKPFSIHSEICKILQQNASPINWKDTTYLLFGDEIGNNDILVNSINSYSPIISIYGEIVQLKKNKTYEELTTFINVDISTNRDNKEYFFDLFIIPKSKSDIQQNVEPDITTKISQQDIDLINQIQNSSYTQTEKNQIITARIGQGYFRRNLVSECGFCPVTLVDDSRLLIASHIKPWRDSNNQERINHKNGILLTPTLDSLFDSGFISFTNDKLLIISPLISDLNFQRLRLTPNMRVPHLPVEGREQFLEYHRTSIFKV